MISDISIVSIILTILLVGVSLGSLIWAVQKMMYKLLDDIRQEIRDMRQEMLEMRKEMRDMRQEQAESREQVAGRLGKVEGLLEGLREFLTSRRAA